MPHLKLRNINRVALTNKQPVVGSIYVSYIRIHDTPTAGHDHLAFIYLFLFLSVHQFDFFFLRTRWQSPAILNSYNVNHYLKCPRASYECARRMQTKKKKLPFFYREKKSDEQEWKFVRAHCSIIIKWSDCVTEGNGSRQQQRTTSAGISK